MAVTVPAGIKDLNSTTISLSCPENVTTSDYLKCLVTINGGGSMLTMKTDYGDGTQESFRLIDPERIEYDISVPQAMVNQSVYSKASLDTTSTYLLANSYFEYDGLVESLEIYATNAGTINLYVSWFKVIKEALHFYNAIAL